MKKIRKVGLLAASALMTGVAAVAPLAGVPSTVMAAESDSLELNIKENARGAIISSAAGRVDVGEVFTLEAKPYDGYRFAYWELKASSGYGGYEIVDGELSDVKISVRADETAGTVFQANAVFISSDEHIVLKNAHYMVAKTGEVIDLSDDIISYYTEDDEGAYFAHSDVLIYRMDDSYANVTEQVFDEESKMVTVPDYDIRISCDKMIGSFSKVLDSGLIMEEEAVFSIEDATGGLVALPEEAHPGEEVEIVTVQPEDYNGDKDGSAFVTANYKIERVSDGLDMTDTLMIEGSKFIMPGYNVRIVVDTVAYGITPERSASEGESAEIEEYQEKVLAGYQQESSDEQNQRKSDTAGGGVQTEASVVSGDVQASAEDDKEADKADTKGTTATGVVADVKKAAASQPSTRIVANGSAASQNAAQAPVNTPAAVRYEGGKSTSASSVSAPATGDYSITGIVSLAAVAAGVGIVAAAVMMKKKMAD